MGGPGSGRKKGSGGGKVKSKSKYSPVTRNLLKEANKNKKNKAARERIATLQKFRGGD